MKQKIDSFFFLVVHSLCQHEFNFDCVDWLYQSFSPSNVLPTQKIRHKNKWADEFIFCMSTKLFLKTYHTILFFLFSHHTHVCVLCPKWKILFFKRYQSWQFLIKMLIDSKRKNSATLCTLHYTLSLPENNKNEIKQNNKWSEKKKKLSGLDPNVTRENEK